MLTTPKYIEYEALKKKINDAQAEKDKFPFNSLYEIGYHNGLTMALTLVMQSPAANVAQVQHGRWDKWNGDNRHHCTVCECYANAERDAYGYITSEFLDNYCPKCGAIMATE